MRSAVHRSGTVHDISRYDRSGGNGNPILVIRRLQIPVTLPPDRFTPVYNPIHATGEINGIPANDSTALLSELFGDTSRCQRLRSFRTRLSPHGEFSFVSVPQGMYR